MEAQQQARNSLQNAKASQGDTSKAFQELLAAWQGLQQFSGDPSSRALANELKATLKEYGESLNELAVKNKEITATRKPLTVE